MSPGTSNGGADEGDGGCLIGGSDEEDCASATSK